MSLLRNLLKKPPNGIVWIFERIYAFDCCYTTEGWEQEDYKGHISQIIYQFMYTYPETSIKVFSFGEGDNDKDKKECRIKSALSEIDVSVENYPWEYEGCPLLSVDVMHRFLESSERWLSVNKWHKLILHSELGGWPVLSFMVAALMIYRKKFSIETKALDVVHYHFPSTLVPEMVSIDAKPSQLRYLKYVSRKNEDAKWPPIEKALTLDCVIMRMIPDFDGKGGCCPIFRIYGRDPLLRDDKTPKLLFSTPRRKYYNQADDELVIIDVNCNIQGDVVLECISLHDDMVKEKIMYRVMFNTTFIKSNMLMLNRDEIDICWDAKEHFHTDFRAELLFSKMDTTDFFHWSKLNRTPQGSLWVEAEKSGPDDRPDIDFPELEILFSLNSSSNLVANVRTQVAKPEKVLLIEHRRAYNCEIMLSKLKRPVHELMEIVLNLDDSAMDLEQVDTLIKYCPTKEEMELIKAYEGEKNALGKCELFYMELMKVPRSEAKLRVFSYKLQFTTQVSDLRKNLNDVYLSVEQIRSSLKFRRVMQTILSLGNALNQGTARGAAVGFKLDSLLKLNETRAKNNKMTLMHYLCKVLADQLPELLDFSKELGSLEAATKIQLKSLAEEMQAVIKGLEKAIPEKKLCKKDGHVSKCFRKSLKKFLSSAESEVKSLTSLYSLVGKSVDALILYFGEYPKHCPYEQVVTTLYAFMNMFNQAHEENCKQIEAEKKAQREQPPESAFDINDDWTMI
ncbi:formin-like protein 17 [Rutidosis leptorrhynchoides]|uniref:formin-like protein 17 n=1 Tax=Rutidosis leptorrhynchoides TaxID=125765 RepID=UPI003A99DD32